MKMTKKRKAKGILPSKSWLMKNGYKGLVECMEKHPDKFAHIEQEKALEKSEKPKKNK